LIPDLSNINNIAFLTGIFLFFAGIEVSGVHALEVKNPQKDYPKAIFISAIIVTLIFLLGSLAIAVILPKDQISLTAGIMQTFKIVFDKFGLVWAIPAIVVLAAPGMIVQVSAWIAGPSRGLLVTAEDGSLPPFFQKLNKNNMPVNIMLVQGIIVSIISLAFLFAPTVSNSFWILTDMAAVLYLIVYIIMFATAIKLRQSQPNTPRPYKIPGGVFGLWFFVVIGVLACISAIILGFFPPTQLQIHLFRYEFSLILGLIIFMIIPFIILLFKKPSWKKEINLEQ
jgi:amino acid transporter